MRTIRLLVTLELDDDDERTLEDVRREIDKALIFHGADVDLLANSEERTIPRSTP